MSTGRAPPPQRLFIALWPPPRVGRRLGQIAVQLQAVCGGRIMPVQNLHITLAFLGKVPGARVGLVQQAMGSAAGAGFDLVLDQLRLRKRGGMVWARAGEVPSALAQLVMRLRHALAACEFAVEDRAFVPHITLLRDVRACVPLPDFVPLAWSIDAMALVRSELARDGAHYETLFQVPLAG